MNIDITIIEINPKNDGIDNYLELDENDIYKNQKNIKLEYKNKSIYILHYPKGKLSVSYGIINDIIDNKKINHKCNTEEGSSGSPILSLETFKVIGIHYGSSQNRRLNYGIFIKYAIDLFNNKNKYKKVKEYYDNEKLKFEGEYLNGEKNGKGKEYFKSGILRFEGEYLNGERNGKGKEYNYNGIIIFEGEYLNGKRHGKGKTFYINEGKLAFKENI